MKAFCPHVVEGMGMVVEGGDSRSMQGFELGLRTRLCDFEDGRMQKEGSLGGV